MRRLVVLLPLLCMACTRHTLIHSFRALPDSSLISRDTLCYHLSDESGNLCGQGINLLQYETRAGTLPLRTGEETQIRIHHLMRRETLPYIMEVGVRVAP